MAAKNMEEVPKVKSKRRGAINKTKLPRANLARLTIDAFPQGSMAIGHDLFKVALIHVSVSRWLPTRLVTEDKHQALHLKVQGRDYDSSGFVEVMQSTRHSNSEAIHRGECMIYFIAKEDIWCPEFGTGGQGIALGLALKKLRVQDAK